MSGILVFAIDVSEQVRTRQEKELQRQLVANVFGQAPVSIALLPGPAFVVESINNQCLAILGRTREQLVGRPYA